jgi:hypothetical protein
MCTKTQMMSCNCMCFDSTVMFLLSLMGTYAGFITHILFYMKYQDESQTYNTPGWCCDNYTFLNLGYYKWMLITFILGMIIFSYVIFLTLTSWSIHTICDDCYFLGCFKIRSCRQFFFEENSFACINGLFILLYIVYMVFIFIGMATIKSMGLNSFKEWMIAITCLQSISIPLLLLSWMCSSFSHPIQDFSNNYRHIEKKTVTEQPKLQKNNSNV